MPVTDSFATFTCGIAVLATYLWLRRYVARRKLSLPPSPQALPIVGNLFNLAGSIPPHIKMRNWSREFNEDIISLDILGRTIIVLSSIDAVVEFFDRRGSNYTDRPELPMLVDLMGWDWTFALMRQGPKWKKYRKVFHGNFNETAKVAEYQDIQPPIVKQLLMRLLNSPERFREHIRLHSASVIMKRVYGHDVRDESDPYVELAEKATRSTSEAAVPGAFLVDILPILKHVPEWMPGATFRRKAREWRKLSVGIVNTPFNMVKDKLRRGVAEPCFVSTYLEHNHAFPSNALDEKLLKEIAAVVYAGGADTSVSVVTSFVLAMTLYPESQKRAYDELRSITGDERLPTYEDRPRLPFLTAVVREVLRWVPVLPLAIPHRAVRADRYKEYNIPADATIIGNAWAILHDERIFTDPESFRPERFIEDPSLPDPADIGVFGFGRRICAGRNMALDTVWIAIASIIAVFEISKAVDENGKVITPELAIDFGALCHPSPFKCRIEPRSEATLALLDL